MCFKTQFFILVSHKNHHCQLIDFLKLFQNSWTFHFSKTLRDVKQKQRHSTKLTSLFELLLTISEILQGCPIYHVMESFWDWNYLKLCKATTCKQTTKNFWRQENTSLFKPWNFFRLKLFEHNSKFRQNEFVELLVQWGDPWVHAGKRWGLFQLFWILLHDPEELFKAKFKCGPVLRNKTQWESDISGT